MCVLVLNTFSISRRRGNYRAFLQLQKVCPCVKKNIVWIRKVPGVSMCNCMCEWWTCLKFTAVSNRSAINKIFKPHSLDAHFRLLASHNNRKRVIFFTSFIGADGIIGAENVNSWDMALVVVLSFHSFVLLVKTCHKDCWQSGLWSPLGERDIACKKARCCCFLTSLFKALWTTIKFFFLVCTVLTAEFNWLLSLLWKA